MASPLARHTILSLLEGLSLSECLSDFVDRVARCGECAYRPPNYLELIKFPEVVTLCCSSNLFHIETYHIICGGTTPRQRRPILTTVLGMFLLAITFVMMFSSLSLPPQLYRGGLNKCDVAAEPLDEGPNGRLG